MKICETIWGSYLDETSQVHDSAKTARQQLPRVAKYIGNMQLNKDSTILDIGCGKFNSRIKDFIENIEQKYYGIDPFNKDRNENLNVIKKCMNGNADIICINNVFNVIKEKEIWNNILLQAKNALCPQNGVLLIQVYEGVPNKKEKENNINKLTPIKTRDGWQNRMKIEVYLEFVKSVFSNAKIINTKLSGKLIIIRNCN